MAIKWNDYHKNLRDTLAGLFTSGDDARPVVQDAGLPVARVRLGGSAINVWQSIVEEADRQGKLPSLVSAALDQYPDNPYLLEARKGPATPTPVRGPSVATDVAWEAPTDDETLEKIIGVENNLLPYVFLSEGAERGKAVARIVRGDNSVGTGFLVGENLLVTNHHVFPDADTAKGSRCEFNFQQNADGLDQPAEVFRFDVSNGGFWTDRDHDLSAARLEGAPGATYGTVSIDESTVAVKDRVSIIQHPGGGPKQVALHDNVVVYVDDDVVQYLTDTMPGSSGAPVFDRRWRLAAVHHSGGWMREPGSKQRYFRNEGIPVSILRRGLADAGLLPAN